MPELAVWIGNFGIFGLTEEWYEVKGGLLDSEDACAAGVKDCAVVAGAFCQLALALLSSTLVVALKVASKSPAFAGDAARGTWA